MKSRSSFIIFVLGIGVGILAWNLFTLFQPAPVYGDATSGGSEGLIAVTGLVANGISGLWVIDARDSETSPSLCLYIPENSGKSIRFIGARRIKWDIQILQWNDKTETKYSPSKLRNEVEKRNKEAQEKADKEK